MPDPLASPSPSRDNDIAVFLHGLGKFRVGVRIERVTEDNIENDRLCFLGGQPV